MESQSTQILYTTNNEPQKQLLIKSITWKKNSHSLFDYELCSDVVKNELSFSLQNLKLPQKVLIYRHKVHNSVKFFYVEGENINTTNGYWMDKKNERKNDKQSDVVLSSNSGFNQNVQLLGAFSITGNLDLNLFQIKFHESHEFEDGFLDRINEKNVTDASSSGLESTKEGISMIVRSLKNAKLEPQGFPLRTGQKLKLGRVQYKVTVVKQQQGASLQKINQIKQKYDDQEVMAIDDKIVYNQNEHQCKVCLSYSPYGQLDQFFFCTPCKCAGSVGLVHFNCLKQWWHHIKLKGHSNSENYLVWDLQKFKCEVCQAQIPQKYIYKDKLYALRNTEISFEKPYLCLQTKTQRGQSFLFVKNRSEQQLTIGRSNNSHIRIPDSSVSRNHAKLVFKQNEFYIFDMQSKFGTVVSDPNLTIPLSKNRKGVQIGRTIITFCIDRPDSGEKKSIDIEQQSKQMIKQGDSV